MASGMVYGVEHDAKNLGMGLPPVNAGPNPLARRSRLAFGPLNGALGGHAGARFCFL